jgi:hypothetical protein
MSSPQWTLQILRFWTSSIILFLFKTLSYLYLNHKVSETGVCLHLQIKPTCWIQSTELALISGHLEIGTSFIDWAQLSRCLPQDGDRIQSPKHCDLNKNRMMDNLQKHNTCINVSSWTLFNALIDNIKHKKYIKHSKTMHIHGSPPPKRDNHACYVTDGGGEKTLTRKK